MKLVALYYFSGTGNTELVANMIKEEFINLECNVDLIRIEDVIKGSHKIAINKYDLVGIGCQVIGYGVPCLVNDFIRLLPREKNKKVFVFRTAGGVAPINYNTSKLMIRALTKKGYDVFYERIFSISSNWIIRFDDGVIKQLYEVSRKKVSIMCREVISGQKRILQTGIRLKVLMLTAALIFPQLLRLVGKDIKVKESCSKCGLCIKNCPSNNIYEKNEMIKFKLSCNSCLRCVYSCPENAITFRFLSFFSVKGGYNIRKILTQECNSNETEKRPEPAFFKEYIKSDAL